MFGGRGYGGRHEARPPERVPAVYFDDGRLPRKDIGRTVLNGPGSVPGAVPATATGREPCAVRRPRGATYRTRDEYRARVRDCGTGTGRGRRHYPSRRISGGSACGVRRVRGVAGRRRNPNRTREIRAVVGCGPGACNSGYLVVRQDARRWGDACLGGYHHHRVFPSTRP
ncbi:Uncharacterised protein [Mycobacteroides abscessus subsp. massiliense]|nr:Uncharacterised protein [Mycobacteroides abscessus subsp. massiliense]